MNELEMSLKLAELLQRNVIDGELKCEALKIIDYIRNVRSLLNISHKYELLCDIFISTCINVLNNALVLVIQNKSIIEAIAQKGNGSDESALFELAYSYGGISVSDISCPYVAEIYLRKIFDCVDYMSFICEYKNIGNDVYLGAKKYTIATEVISLIEKTAVDIDIRGKGFKTYLNLMENGAYSSATTYAAYTKEQK
jgi:hypothetical protein